MPFQLKTNKPSALTNDFWHLIFWNLEFQSRIVLLITDDYIQRDNQSTDSRQETSEKVANLIKWANSKSFEEFNKNIYAFDDSKKSQQYNNLMAVLEEKLCLVKKIQDMGLMTKALENIHERMKSCKIKLNQKANLFDRLNWKPGPGTYF